MLYFFLYHAFLHSRYKRGKYVQLIDVVLLGKSNFIIIKENFRSQFSNTSLIFIYFLPLLFTTLAT